MSAGGDDYFSYQAKKFKPKTAYPDSKMKVWTKPERKEPEVDVEETDASASMIQRIIGKFRAED